MVLDDTPKPQIGYAVGDIHGMHQQLEALLQVIAKDAEAHGKPFVVVFLGDMIDRGPDSALVVATIKSLCCTEPDRYKAILGNHEVMWLNAMLNPKTDHVSFWASEGGNETYDSYQKEFEQTLWEHLHWLQHAVPILFETDHHVFVHAGLRPHVPLAEQTPSDMLWIRETFLHNDSYMFEKHVVHGHSPNPYGPQVRENRTGLDTGCHYSGALTAGVFDLTQPGGMVRALQVKGKPA